MKKLRYLNVLGIGLMVSVSGTALAQTENNNSQGLYNDKYPTHINLTEVKQNQGGENKEEETQTIDLKNPNIGNGGQVNQGQNNPTNPVNGKDNSVNNPITQNKLQKNQNSEETIILNLQSYLNNDLGWDTYIDEEDNSLNFKDNGELYWITVEPTEDKNTYLYTLHANSVISDQPELVDMFAVNTVSKENPYKAFRNDKGRIEFVITSYATSPNTYADVIMTMVEKLQGAKDYYKAGVNGANRTADMIFQNWENKKKEAESQTKLFIPTPEVSKHASLEIKNIQFKGLSINAPNAEPRMSIDYGYPLELGRFKFLVPQITYNNVGKNTGALLTVKVINPDGQLLVYDPSDNYTMIDYVQLKPGQNQNLELKAIGTHNDNFWKEGQYKIIISENGDELKSLKFNIQQ